MKSRTEHSMKAQPAGAIARSVALVAPNLPTFWFVLCGALIEALLLGRYHDNIYKTGGFGTITVVLWLVWFWFITGWAYWAVAIGAVLLGRRWPRWARVLGTCFLVALLFPVIILYFESWSLYLRTGQFVNLETLKFVLNNPLPFADGQIFRAYLAEAKKAEYWGLGLIALPFYARLVAGVPRVSQPASSRRNRIPRFTGYTLTLLLLVPLAVVRSDHSVLRSEGRLAALRFHLNPWVALAASWVESINEDDITPCLDVTKLRPISPASWKTPPGAGKILPSVIFVKVEALRREAVGLTFRGTEIMPNLNGLAKSGLNATRAYAPSTHTDYSDVSIMSSLYPLWSRRHYYYEASDPWPRTRIYDLLKTAGYDTAIFSSENEKWGCKDVFLRSPNLDLLFDAEHSGVPTRMLKEDTGVANEIRAGALSAGILDDRQTTDAAITWIKQCQTGNKPFFLYLDLQSSHFPYAVPEDCERPFQPAAMDFNMSFVWYPPEKTEQVRNAYLNALHECDRQLGRLLAALRELDRLEHMILVIYGDHGEAFHENGQVTHAREPIEATARTGCVMYAPAYLRAGIEDYPVQLIDLVPTVLGLMGWPEHPGLQGINFLSAARPALEDRLVFVHTENPLTRADAVVLAGRWKFIHNRRTGEEGLFDLSNDPGEQNNKIQVNITIANRLRKVLSDWRCRQLAYYHYPFYYENYYPPGIPHAGDVTTNSAMGSGSALAGP